MSVVPSLRLCNKCFIVLLVVVTPTTAIFQDALKNFGFGKSEETTTTRPLHYNIIDLAAPSLQTKSLKGLDPSSSSWIFDNDDEDLLPGSGSGFTPLPDLGIGYSRDMKGSDDSSGDGSGVDASDDEVQQEFSYRYTNPRPRLAGKISDALGSHYTIGNTPTGWPDRGRPVPGQGVFATEDATFVDADDSENEVIIDSENDVITDNWLTNYIRSPQNKHVERNKIVGISQDVKVPKLGTLLTGGRMRSEDGKDGERKTWMEDNETMDGGSSLIVSRSETGQPKM